MINLTGKDLSGLARGVEMFKSVKRADERLNAGADGFRGLAHIDPEEAKQNSYSDDQIKKDGEIWDKLGPTERSSWLAAAGFKLPSSKSSSWANLAPLTKEALMDAPWHGLKNTEDKSQYPHDIFENKSSGLKLGSKKFGNK